MGVMMRFAVVVAVLLGVSTVDARQFYTKGPRRVEGYLQEKEHARGTGLCDSTVKQLSGYFKIDEANKTNEHYFYWVFESRSNPSTDPFIIWMTGGPGCYGMLALLNENGPCTIDKSLQPQNNPYSWTTRRTCCGLTSLLALAFH